MAKLILAEDEAIVAMATKMMLRDLSHELITVVSAAELAVTEVIKNDVDLVLMDIKLKGEMDGIQAAEEIRKTKNVPIIFITGNSDERTRQRISKIENSSILLKPVMIEDLRISLKKLLN
jgi:two-component system, response regulator PdtaR